MIFRVRDIISSVTYSCDFVLICFVFFVSAKHGDRAAPPYACEGDFTLERPRRLDDGGHSTV